MSSWACLGGLAGLLLVKRFDGLGDRRLPEYLLARLRHRFNRHPITLPRILPAGTGSFDITDLDGNLLARFGSNGDEERIMTIVQLSAFDHRHLPTLADHGYHWFLELSTAPFAG